MPMTQAEIRNPARKPGEGKAVPPKAAKKETADVNTPVIAAQAEADLGAGPAPGGAAGATFCIAVDDGHSETKIAYLRDGARGPIVTRSFPSRTARGLIEVDAHGGAGANAYRTYEDERVASGDGDIIMIVPRGRNAEETGDNRTQEYPTSDRNRALVHHALHLVAPEGARLQIGTTLPYSDFHLPVTGGHNLRLIEAKKANIAKPVRLIDRQSLKSLPQPYVVADHGVYSEGVAAFFDCMLSLDEDGALSLNASFCERFAYVPSFAIVDVGGKTTDIVYGTWSGNPEDQPMINIAQSESLKAGVLDAADDLESKIKQDFNVRSVVDREDALINRKVPIYGVLRDIGHLADAALKPLATRIREAVYRYAEDGSGLAYVIFVGGGSVLLKQHLEVLFDPSLVYVPSEPRFSNARGVLKIMLAEGDDADR